MAKITNNDLKKRIDENTKRIQEIDQKNERRHRSLNRSFNTFKKEVSGKLDVLHDWVIGHEKFEEGFQKGKSGKNGSDIKISKEAWKLILIIVGFIGTALTIIAGLTALVGAK